MSQPPSSEPPTGAQPPDQGGPRPARQDAGASTSDQLVSDLESPTSGSRWWWIAAAVVGAIIVVVVLVQVFGADEPEPGASGTPTATATPTPEPTATGPSASPTPTDPAAGVRDWADDTFGDFDPATVEGTSADVVPLPEGASGGLVTAVHEGEGNFAVSVLDAANQPTGELLVNTIGAYQGTTAFGVQGLGDGVALQVQASGKWTLTLAPISTAPVLAPSGQGDAVFLYGAAAATLSVTNEGEGNFVVQQYTGNPLDFGLLVNEIGPYQGKVPLTAGPSVVSVQSTGAWTMSVG